MPDFIPAMLACPLFSGFSSEEFEALTGKTNYLQRQFAKNEVIAFEEDECFTLGVILQGSIHFQRIYPSGKIVIIDTLRAGSCFGEALIFADDGRYPATLVAADEVVAIFILKEDASEFIRRSTRFQENFLRMLSNRVLTLNRRIKGLQYSTVRQKVANYLLEEYRRQKTKKLTILSSRNILADQLGIPRPSLSRELVALQADGLIEFKRNLIQVLEPDALEKCLG